MHHTQKRTIYASIFLIALWLLPPAAAHSTHTWRGSWRAPVLQTDGSTYKARWDVDALIAELQATQQNLYAYHVDHAEDLLQIWDDTDACGATDDLEVATDQSSSLALLEDLMRSGTDIDASEDALDPDNHSGTKKTLLELIQATDAAGLSLALQFQKTVGSSCPSSGTWLSEDELTRVAHFMSHLSMAYPHVVAWFIDDFMGYLCDPWDDASSSCLDADATARLQLESEPAALWLFSTSTKAPYVVAGAHVLSAEDVKLTASDALEMKATLHFTDFETHELISYGAINVSFLTFDNHTADYDPSLHCARDGVLAVEVDGRLVLEDFLSDGHDAPNAVGGARVESFELHRIQIPTFLLLAADPDRREVELTFSLRLPDGQPADYDPVGCASAGTTWSTLSTSTAKSVYVWDLRATIGSQTLNEADGHFEVTYTTAAKGVVAASADLDLDHAASTDGVIINVARNDGYVTEDEADRYVESICDRDDVGDCLLNLRATRFKDKDPELDNALLGASLAHADGLLLESASNALANLPAEAGVFSQWPSGWRSYEHVLMRPQQGQYGLLGWFQGYHFELTSALDSSGGACDLSQASWTVQLTDGGDDLVNAEALVFQQDADAGPPQSILRTTQVGEGRTVAIDADADQVLVVLHQTNTLSGKRPFLAFSLLDQGSEGCTAEGTYVTGVHDEAILFYLCTTEVFMGGDANCGGYGDYSPNYWWFDPAPFFD